MMFSIRRLYEAPLRHRNPKVVSLHYKFNKAIVNLLYPILGRCDYGLDDSSNVIISLTSYPARINTVYLTITSLLDQTVKPSMVVIWLANEQFPGKENDLPRNLLRLKEKGLSIRFCDDIKPHKKYYYTMKENLNSYIITVDDDVFYPENLVSMLMETSAQFPDTVVCTWGHKITDSSDPGKWEPDMDGTEPSFKLAPTGIGGVLYPPHCLSEEVFNIDAIRELCLNADDLWLKAMGIKNGRMAVRVNKPAKIFFTILKTQKNGLYYENALEDKNTVAWRNIMKAYPECWINDL